MKVWFRQVYTGFCFLKVWFRQVYTGFCFLKVWFRHVLLYIYWNKLQPHTIYIIKISSQIKFIYYSNETHFYTNKYIYNQIKHLPFHCKTFVNNLDIVLLFRIASIRDESSHCWKKKGETSYSVPKYLHFLAIWTKFVKKKRKSADQRKTFIYHNTQTRQK